MSIADNIAALTTARNNIRDALEEKGVDASTHGFSSFAEDIRSISGDGSVAWNDVTFIDYDGTVLYSYTLLEVHGMTTLPPTPSHPGLVCVGWNWTLADIKAENKGVIVGALYETNNGATRLYMNIDDPDAMSIFLRLTIGGTENISIDWGDGSPFENYDTSTFEVSHAYTNIGQYTISIHGGTLSFGYGAYGLLRSIPSSNKVNVLSSYLERIEVGNNITSLGNNSLYGCDKLKSVTLHGGVVSVGSRTFRECVSLQSIVLPSAINRIENSIFMNCMSMESISLPKTIELIRSLAFSNSSIKHISIPSNVVQIEDEAFLDCVHLTDIEIPARTQSLGVGVFSGCRSLRHFNILAGLTDIPDSLLKDCVRLTNLTIPSSVATIGSNAIGPMYSLKKISVGAVFPPSLVSSNSFWGIEPDCTIYVPPGSLLEYQNATNWSTYAYRMREEIM